MESPIVVNTRDGYDHDLHRQELLDLPPGFRFHPTDEEIITHYLTEKVMNTSFQAYAIGEVDLNKSEPWDLPSKAKMGEKEFYFFCQRDRKYPTGMRTNRATEAGYWKATGKDKEIYNKGKSGNHSKNYLVGMKKTLVFYKGRAPKGEKSNWVMHEYRLDGKFSYYNLPMAAKDEWVVCRVFHKNTAAAAAAAGIKKIPSVNYHHQGMMMTMMPSSFNGHEFLYDPYAASLPALMDPPSAAAAAASGSPSTSSRSYFLDQNSHPQNQTQASYDHAGGAMMSPGGYGGGQYQYQQCKAEQFSFTTNQSSAMISRSQDTTGALSTDRNTTAEISSVVSKLQQDDYRDLDATSIAEFDNFCWDY